jgi:hypothetical protein
MYHATNSQRTWEAIATRTANDGAGVWKRKNGD